MIGRINLIKSAKKALFLNFIINKKVIELNIQLKQLSFSKVNEAGWIIRVEKHNTYTTSPHNSPKRIILKTPEQMHFNFRYNMESEIFQGELFEDPADNSMVRVSRLPFEETKISLFLIYL